MSQLFLGATERSTNFHYICGDSTKSFEQTGKEVDVTFTRGSKNIFDLVMVAGVFISKIRSLILNEQVLKDSYNFLAQYIAFFRVSSRRADPKLRQWYNAPKCRETMIHPHRDTSTMRATLYITMLARGQRDVAMEDATDKETGATKRMLHEYLEDAGFEAKWVMAGMEHAEDF